MLIMASAGLVVIGSGPAGVSAADAFRQHNPHIPVRIVTEDPAAPCFRPPLSKEYLRGDDSDISLHPADWFDDHSIALTRNSTVCDIDISGKTVIDTDVVRYDYAWLVLTCGARPTLLPVPGASLACCCAASPTPPGCAPPPDTPRPRSSSAPGSSAVKRRHPLHCRGFRRSWSHRSQYRRLAAAAGITTIHGRFAVDEYQRTSVENVFAAGDVALAHNPTAGRRVAVEHWQDAIDQGEVAGTNAGGGSAVWDSVPGFWTTIGDATLKCHAWGDGFHRSRLIDHDNGFTVWYETEGKVVGVLTLNADEDYARAEALIRHGDPVPVG
jgi:3-phenylpropionate/trans-cinnamate dioxygenase ferredoxin reductase component